MKRKQFISLFLFCIISCGCQASPASGVENESESKINDVSAFDIEENTSSFSSDSSEQNFITTIPYTPENLSEVISSDKFTININANVELPQTNTLYNYECNHCKFDKDDASMFINYFGAETNSVKTNEYADMCIYDFFRSEYPNEMYTVSLSNDNLKYYGHTDNLCPYGTNAYEDFYAEVLSRYTSGDAVIKCEEVCNMVYADSVLLYIIPYGKSIGKNYYKLSFAPLIDGVPVLSSKAMAKFDFSDKGINSMELSNLRFSSNGIVDELISLDEAVEELKKQIDNIDVYPLIDMVDVFNYNVDEFGKLKTIEISKIQIAYAVRYKSGKNTLFPVWAFVPGCDGVSDYSCIIAVDAINREVFCI